jgi:hypothetical protein
MSMFLCYHNFCSSETDFDQNINSGLECESGGEHLQHKALSSIPGTIVTERILNSPYCTGELKPLKLCHCSLFNYVNRTLAYLAVLGYVNDTDMRHIGIVCGSFRLHKSISRCFIWLQTLIQIYKIIILPILKIR